MFQRLLSMYKDYKISQAGRDAQIDEKSTTFF